jgi:hypothetical protein
VLCEDEDTFESTTSFDYTSCDKNEELVGTDCIGTCPSDNCGSNATCVKINYGLFCKCLRGYTGDPRSGCFKMDEQNPCSPSPCGLNSECIAEHAEIGPHCKCLENFFDFPPNCRSGCVTHKDCEANHLCNSKNYCVNMCADSRCGPNSICRVDQEKFIVHCSCKDGFFPENGIGCREMKPEDSEIPFDFLIEATTDPCGEKCGSNAYCDDETKTCVCSQGYIGDPEKECTLVVSNSTNLCSPNPCGPYSECTVTDKEKNCACVDGYGHSPPYCYKCKSAMDCGTDHLCVGGKCVGNICSSFCGEFADCKINTKKIECSCRTSPNNNLNKPFSYCADLAFIPPNLIGTLLG